LATIGIVIGDVISLGFVLYFSRRTDLFASSSSSNKRKTCRC
jgi:hypothetical protein